MGKKRQQVRRQVRQVKPKLPAQAAPSQVTPAAQKKQREKYVQSGGLLQGYAPELVVRIGYYAAGAAVFCLLVMLLLIALHPWGLPVGIAAAIAWVVPIAFMASFILPGFRLARADRKKEPRLVQGTLLGASTMSTSIGLGMLMVKTRGGVEQFLVPPEKLARVPGNQVPVMVTVTPLLKHVRNVGIMGQKMVPRPDQPVPEVVRRLRLLPIVTPAALAVAAIVGDDAVALLPIVTWNGTIHAVIAILAGALLGGGVYGLSFIVQRRMYAEVQQLMPGGLG